MQVTVFHPGTQHSWQTALALQQLGRLDSYRTSIFYQPERWPYRLERILPAPLARRAAAEFRRFSHPGLDPALVQTAGLAEWAERIAARAGLRGLALAIDRIGNRQFVRHLAGSIRSERPFALWGYDGSSLSSFELAQQTGRTCILDRTTIDFREFNRILADLNHEFPNWRSSSDRLIPQKLIDDAEREYELADRICVGSNFAARTVVQNSNVSDISKKLRVISYNYDDSFLDMPTRRDLSTVNQPVRFIFVGQVIARKGIHLLLQAISALAESDATLTVVGDVLVDPRALAPYSDRVRFIQSVPRSRIPQLMSEADVLVLPSYLEGGGIVLAEALASGCAIIQSDRCAEAATADCGFVLKNLTSDELKLTMETYICDRGLLAFHRSNAALAARRFSFDEYAKGVARLISELEQSEPSEL